MSLSRILYIWAKCDSEKQALLNSWLDEAMTACADGKGQTLLSSTANNVSVAFMSNSTTIIEWMSALVEALEIINNPNKGKRKAIQIFR